MKTGSFAFNVSVNNDLNGINPLFIVLSYSQQQQQNLNTNSGSALSSNPQQNLNTNSGSTSSQFDQSGQTFTSIATKSNIKAIVEPNPDFNVKGISITKDSINDLVVVGEIQNMVQQEKQFVKVIITPYDASNAILTTYNTYTEPSTLQPGQSGPFKDYISQESVGGDLNAVKSLKIALTSD